MPNRRVGKNIMHRVGGHWKVKQHCKSIASAKKAMDLLRGLSHGWKPIGRKRR